MLVEHAKQRAESVQNRIADRITAFSGSMWFAYIHITSTFVMISQNRAHAKRQVIADLLEQAHEVPRGDYDRRLTTGCAALTVTTHHFITRICAPPPSRIRLASDRLRQGGTSGHGRH